MLLVIDVGNTNTSLGVYRGEELLAHWRLTTNPSRTVDEYGVHARNLFELRQVQEQFLFEPCRMNIQLSNGSDLCLERVPFDIRRFAGRAFQASQSFFQVRRLSIDVRAKPKITRRDFLSLTEQGTQRGNGFQLVPSPTT